MFIVVAAGVVGISTFLRRQPPLKISVAADSLIVDWVREAAARFNASGALVDGTRRAEIEVSVANDVSVWRGEAGWTAQQHPNAWIAAASSSVSYARSANLPLEMVMPSTARTLLVWGGYASRVQVITQDGALPFDWETVAAAAKIASWEALGGQRNWQFLKLAFALPDSSMNGLAVLFTGAASFRDMANLDGGATRGQDFYNWLVPVIDSVPSFQTLGADVAKAMARGPSTVELALLPESQWLLNLPAMTSHETVILSYPAYQFVFDFPVALWDDASTDSTTRAAVSAFGAWLAKPDEQARLPEKGLRPAAGGLTEETAGLFTRAAAYGVLLDPAFTIIQPPNRTEAQGLIQWFLSNQRR